MLLTGGAVLPCTSRHRIVEALCGVHTGPPSTRLRDALVAESCLYVVTRGVAPGGTARYAAGALELMSRAAHIPLDAAHLPGMLLRGATWAAAAAAPHGVRRGADAADAYEARVCAGEAALRARRAGVQGEACSHCGARNVTYENAKQTASLDEPARYRAECLSCGHSWTG